MKIITQLSEMNAAGSVVCVGTFDGLHKGHQVVIGRTVEHAKRMGLQSVVFTFWPHPHEVIFPDKPVSYLNTYSEKAILFQNLGVDILVLYPFDKEFSNISAQDFIKHFLIEKLGMKFLVVGHDHQFGKERQGSFDKLKACAQDWQFDIERIEVQSVGDVHVSSTKIRNLIKEGRIEQANQLLGYEYFVGGTVIKGHQIGRTLGYPTANIEIEAHKVLPSKGVYAVRVQIDQMWYDGVANLGHRPSIKASQKLNLEVYIFDLNLNLYGQFISIRLVKKLRDEQQFNSLDELKKQIDCDVTICKQFFELEQAKNIKL